MKKFVIMLLAALLVGILPLEAYAVEDVSALIAGLPTVEEFKHMDADAQLEAYNRTQAAYDGYMALSEEERAQVGGAEETFQALFSYFNAQVMPITEEGTREASIEEPLADGQNDSLSGTVATALSVVLAVFLLKNLKKKKL